MSDEVDDAIAALHQGALDAFLEGRKGLAAKLKKAGDKDGAARVAAVPKPTPSAWATNRASQSARDAFVDLLQVGVALRDAMRKALRGEPAEDVASLQRRQRAIVEALLGEAKRLLEEAELPASDVVMGRVRTNLTTIGTSGRWGDAPAACLSKDLAPLDVAGLAALLEVTAHEPSPADPPGPATKPDRSPDPSRDAAAESAAARRAREEERKVLGAALAAAEEAHRSREIDLADLVATTEAAEAAAADGRERAATLAREATRIAEEAALARARAESAEAEARARELTAAGARRERDRAEAEAIRSRTHVLAARERLERHGGDDP